MASFTANPLGRVKLVKSLVTIVFCMVVGYAHLTTKTDSRQKQRLEETNYDGASRLKNVDRFIKDEFLQDETSRRRLLFVDENGDDDEDNCTVRGISKFPRGVFTNEQRKGGALVVNFLVSLYLCGAIGYVCAAYFVPSLEILCERLKLQPDVAGATFMAAGSSAPELFSAVIGTFISYDDTGLSAIVGSAAFNIFVIISLCCFLAGQELVIHWWPFCRDCFVYVISIILMVVVLLDGEIQWWEGLILSCGYIVYIVIMYFNPYLSKRAEEIGANWRRRGHNYDNPSEEEDTVSLLSDQHNEVLYGEAQTPNGELSGRHSYGTVSDYENGYIPDGGSYPEKPRTVTTTSSVVTDHPLLSEQDSHVFSPPSSWFFRVLWFVGLPVILIMFLTVPDCRKPGLWRRLYFFTFFISTVWLAGLAYVLYWMIVVIGYTLDIPDTVMGISLLAAGTSVPDAIASVLVARDGYGDMALSNIVGSNIFEVFICLGLLWFIYGLVYQRPVEIASEGLLFTTVALLVTVAFILLAIHLNGWKLDKKMGVLCMCVYLIFITIAIVWELGLIGGIDLPHFCNGPT
ncbi:sodium/potassium/calcium exchanger 5 [Strongylocentrotus purpuratus]|uniref:Sodium/calcium exchanger membrane region domain-containing protein n=1 Tax=Strongylocentrotus purpuratus TaxID=7668 RepID=A0A7M7N7L9_STRPU|nr:sodium/potassium/calcium exchanger 5 [Strongylocentrotus purpuratus]